MTSRNPPIIRGAEKAADRRRGHAAARHNGKRGGQPDAGKLAARASRRADAECSLTRLPPRGNERSYSPRLPTGQRAAIIYTMVESAKHHGHDPEPWLADVLERLPAMTNRDDLAVLLPSRWQPARRPCDRRTCLVRQCGTRRARGQP